MSIRKELFLLMGALLGVTLALAFGAIGLFVRMGPAIERIMAENVETMAATEELLAGFATGEALDGETQARLRSQLDRIEANITEDAERPLVADVRAHFDTALLGPGSARTHVALQLLRIGQVNREAMARVNDEAKRLGNAGAWSAVSVGFLGFGAGLLALGRIVTRFIKPLEDLDGVLRAAREGDTKRRCVAHQGPVELRRMAQAVNVVLDTRLHEGATPDPSDGVPELFDSAVQALLERVNKPAAVIGGGRLQRANQQLLELLSQQGGQELRQRLLGDARPEEWEWVDLESSGRLVLLPAAS